mgnify:CR=1 FL=1
MDVYHKILIKLYEVTGGRDSKKIDFRDLVRAEGFHPSYDDILSQMSQSGWITESGSAGQVSLTHWGLMEAKKSLAGGGDSKKELEKEAGRLRSNVKEFLVMTEEFASDLSSESFEQLEDKFGVVKNGIDKVRRNL